MADEEAVVEESVDTGADEVVNDDAPESSYEGPAEDAAEEASGEEAAPVEVWSHFRQLPQFNGQDDNAIAGRLYQALQREEALSRQLQQYRSVIPVASEYLANRPSYEQWRQSQQQAQGGQQQPVPQAKPQEEPSPWTPPKLKDSYRQYLVKDENGRDVISPEAPLDAKAALQEHMAFRANFAQRLLDNPEETLQPIISKMARQQAQELFTTEMGRMQEQSFVDRTLEENRDWLYANGKDGDASAEGLAVQKYIEDMKGYGVQGAETRWEMAKKLLERDVLEAHARNLEDTLKALQGQLAGARQVQQQPTADARNMDYLRQQAMRSASRGGSVSTTDSRKPQKPMTFADRFRNDLSEAGYI
ncbi:MAG: hypothetical protein EBR82_65240 [Caulobacteraceae bacterium]|nr:hypothetical protein [Caulobacteraceae bacterium]